MQSNLGNDLKYEINDVRSAIQALHRRVDRIEELACSSTAPPEAQASSTMAISLVSITPEPVGPIPFHMSTDAPVQGIVPDAQGQDIVPEQHTPVLLRSKLQSDAFGSKAPSTVMPTLPSASTSIAKKFPLEQRQTQPEKTKLPEAPKEALEIYIGRNLNKIGISFLVIGCALALIYQFQHFSALFKVLSGIVLGALLILGGERFEKKNAKLDWYGRALIGGGWAMTYFSVFAAYNFDAVRIIQSASVDFFLLLAVAAGAVFHSLKYKSETITGITLTLAFCTICLSPISAYSMLSFALLVAVLSGLVLKMRWFNLFLYGETILYIVYLSFILPQTMSGNNAIFGMSAVDGNFFTALSFSTFCWAALNLVIFTLKHSDAKEEKRLVMATLLNSAAYIPTAMFLMAPSHADMRFGFLLSAGFAYLMSAFSANRNDMPSTSSVHTILGLSLITLAVPFKLTGEWISAFWSLEVPVLVWTGINYKMRSVYRFATGLACLTACATCSSLISIDSFNATLSAIVTIIALSVSAIFCRRSQGDAPGRAFYLYFGLAAALTFGLTNLKVSVEWLACAFSVVSASIVLIGVRLNDSVLRWVGRFGIYAVSMSTFFFTIDHASRVSNLITVGILAYLAYRHRKEEAEKLGYASAAALALTFVLYQAFHGAQFAAAVSLEALALLTFGLMKNDKTMRIVAFCLSVLIVFRFLSVDMESADTINLIILQTHKGNSLPGIIYSTALAIASACYLSQKFRGIVGEAWRSAFYAYAGLMGTVFVFLTLQEMPHQFMALALSLECVATIALGYFTNLMPLRAAGTIGLFSAQAIALTCTAGHWELAPTVALIAIQYLLSYCYSLVNSTLRADFEHEIEHYYGVAGTVTSALLMAQVVPSHWLSVAWTILGVSVLTLGFSIRDKVYRISGLSVLGLVIARLLFVELASLETIYRIISFIAAGVVLLVASLAYAHFNTAEPRKPIETL